MGKKMIRYTSSKKTKPVRYQNMPYQNILHILFPNEFSSFLHGDKNVNLIYHMTAIYLHIDLKLL